MANADQVVSHLLDYLSADLARLYAASLNPAKNPSGVFPEARVHGIFKRPTSAEQGKDVAVKGTEMPQPPDRHPSKSRTNPLPLATSVRSEQVSKLRIGTWIEFTNGRAGKRLLRLKWISKHGSLFFFQDHHTDIPTYVTAERIDQRLRDGSANILTACKA